jgi:hypothetical protein
MGLEMLASMFKSLPTDVPPFSIERFKNKIESGYGYVFFTPDNACPQYIMVERDPDDSLIRIPYPLSQENFILFKDIYEEELYKPDLSDL